MAIEVRIADARRNNGTRDMAVIRAELWDTESGAVLDSRTFHVSLIATKQLSRARKREWLRETVLAWASRAKPEATETSELASLVGVSIAVPDTETAYPAPLPEPQTETETVADGGADAGGAIGALV